MIPLKNGKEDRTKTNKTGFSNNSSRSMCSPSFIEFGQPLFSRSDTLSQSGPLKGLHFVKTLVRFGIIYTADPLLQIMTKIVCLR